MKNYVNYYLSKLTIIKLISQFTNVHISKFFCVNYTLVKITLYQNYAFSQLIFFKNTLFEYQSLIKPILSWLKSETGNTHLFFY